MRRILGLFAHPDDEVFCAGGTMARAVADGAEAMVVSLTRGEAGEIRHADLARRSTIGACREAELAEACRVLGIGRSQCLDFCDGQLATTPRAELVAAAIDLIDDFNPDTIISFADDGGYGHPDHITVSQVSVAAAAAASRPPDQVLHARFPRSSQLLLDLIVDWLVELPDRFRGSDTFVNALMMFADSSSMLGFAADHMQLRWFPKGSYIIEQGEPADRLFLLLAGGVEVRSEAPQGAMRVVGQVGPGEFIGETGIANRQPRNAHCVAVQDCACFVLAPDQDVLWQPRGGQVGHTTPVSAQSGTLAPSLGAAPIDQANDVSDVVALKVQALAAHRTQYTIEPGLFPKSIMTELFGTEYFSRAWLGAAERPNPTVQTQGARP